MCRSTPEYVGAVRAYKQASRGDPESYFEWTDQNTYTLSNKFMPSDYGNQCVERSLNFSCHYATINATVPPCPHVHTQ